MQKGSLGDDLLHFGRGSGVVVIYEIGGLKEVGQERGRQRRTDASAQQFA